MQESRHFPVLSWRLCLFGKPASYIRIGNIGGRVGFESSYAASDVPPSITPLTADRMKYVDLNVHDLIAGVFYSRILSPDMAF